MNKRAYVIVHGFGGLPTSVLTVRRELIKNGISSKDIYVPLLSGHGKEGFVRYNVTYETMIAGLKQYVEYCCAKYDKITLIGYSMGGLVSIGTALELEIDQLILLNAPMKIWNFKGFIWTLKTFPKDRKYHINNIFKSLKISRIINSMELKKMIKYTKENLSRVKCQTYIVQSENDYVAKPESGKYIYNNIGADKKEIKWYNNTTHFVPDENEITNIIKNAMEWTMKKENIEV